jgi:hypothetical protein
MEMTGYVHVSATLALGYTPVPIAYEAGLAIPQVWTLYRTGKLFAPTGIQTPGRSFIICSYIALKNLLDMSGLTLFLLNLPVAKLQNSGPTRTLVVQVFAQDVHLQTRHVSVNLAAIIRGDTEDKTLVVEHYWGRHMPCISSFTSELALGLSSEDECC